MSVSDGPGRMPTWLEVRAVAQYAEAVGLDSAWVCYHLLSEPPGQPVEGIAEGWTLLTALAASTARLTLGTLVTPTMFRHPALLAKMAAGVDGISGGRLVLGLGAGVAGAEYRMYGIPAGDRWARFEEELQIIAGLLSGKAVTWSGRFHQLREATFAPVAGPPGTGDGGWAGRTHHAAGRPVRRRMDDRLVRPARRPAARATGRDGTHPGRTGTRPADA